MSSSSTKYVCVFVVCGKCIVFTYTSIYIYTTYACICIYIIQVYIHENWCACVYSNAYCVHNAFVYLYMCIMSVFLDLQMHEVQILNQFSPVCTAYPNLHTKHM